jgi:hypothetical protein
MLTLLSKARSMKNDVTAQAYLHTSVNYIKG